MQVLSRQGPGLAQSSAVDVHVAATAWRIGVGKGAMEFEPVLGFYMSSPTAMTRLIRMVIPSNSLGLLTGMPHQQHRILGIISYDQQTSVSNSEEQAGPLLMESSIYGFCISVFYLKVLAVQAAPAQEPPGRCITASAAEKSGNGPRLCLGATLGRSARLCVGQSPQEFRNPSPSPAESFPDIAAPGHTWARLRGLPIHKSTEQPQNKKGDKYFLSGFLPAQPACGNIHSSDGNLLDQAPPAAKNCFRTRHVSDPRREKHWLPGTQCVTKHDHTKPKPRELAFRKGDMVTIIEAVEGKGWYRARHNETGQEGLLAASALRERGAIRADPKLSLMPWFHGKISGMEAVQELQPPEDGLFLVRESVRHPGDYVLCVSFGKEVIHYRVVHEENTLSIDSQQYFFNLIDMIEHYMKEQGAICTKLVKPKPKSGMKSAEEELAKAGWLLNLKHLTLGDRIGQGEFGDVLQGEYLGQRVAVKNIKCDVTAQAFLAETAAMTKVRHKNLVCLLGVILHNGLYIVMEFMSKGNLVNFLRTRGRALVPTQQLLLFALDVAQGMDYLESKKLVHRDLAARNILISEENVAKVSDFGLARVNPKGADATLLPVKWTAPEALKHNKFSSKSDVWSYGILLWETFSFGRAPYPKLALKEVTELLEQGYRMDAPEGCPPTVYALMKSCWELEPGKRPSFKKLAEKLQKELKHLRDI
ncbi:hypothetical protein DV515_00015244 [Chloebia gouldiae]|uniref:Tyrosine-protein kinase n=1 Tax=Chloebia gouldiae TaxID=44316 RepID=A0A3L8RXE0_CHLGU|nr:hypothetical protein DV515_00015244 [Chloebia gouldiae]